MIAWLQQLQQALLMQSNMKWEVVKHMILIQGTWAVLWEIHVPPAV